MTVYEGSAAVTLRVNGETRTVSVRPADTLLFALRERLGLTGAKPGCLNGDCGACTVVMDGLPVKSCQVLAVEAEGHEVLTVEGLQNDPLQKAFIDARAFQCGYCTPGFLMACHALRENLPQADEAQMEHWLEGNICRCTSYEEIRDAVRRVLPTTGRPENEPNRQNQ